MADSQASLQIILTVWLLPNEPDGFVSMVMPAHVDPPIVWPRTRLLTSGRVRRVCHHMNRRLASVTFAVALLIVSGCASTPPTIPPGRVGEYVQNGNGVGEAYFEGVMRRCVAIAFTAHMHLRGVVEGQRLDRRVRLSADRVAGSLRLESLESKQPPFTFVVKDTFQRQTDVDWTLFSTEGNWVVRGEDSRAAIETIVGIPAPADEFLWMMTGCSPNLSGHLLIGQRFGPTLMKVSLEDVRPLDVELRRVSVASPWTLYAMSRSVPGRMRLWRLEVGHRVSGIHQEFRIVSRQSNGADGAAFDVRVSLSHIEINPRLDRETFSLAVPGAARVVSLETVRRDTFK